MKHAIMILTHKFSYNIIKLLENYDDKNIDFYIHIDKKSDVIIDQFKDICIHSNVHIYKKYNVFWGDFSIVEAELFLLKKAAIGKYDYYHLISGDDFYLMSKDNFLNKFFNDEYSYIGLYDLKTKNDKSERIKYYHFFRKYLQNKSRRKISVFPVWLMYKSILFIQKIFFVNRLRRYKLKEVLYGSEWFSIRDDFLHFIISKEKEIHKIFHNTFAPDEIFMQFFAFSEPNEYKIKKFNLRYIDWKNGNPSILSIENIKDEINNNYIFARKICDNNVIDFILERTDKNYVRKN